MATALTIVNRALRLLGVKAANVSVDGSEGSDALSVLNNIMDEWSNNKLLNHYVLNETFTTTANVGTYSIGPRAQVITDNAGTFTAGSLTVTVNGNNHTETFATNKNTTLTALAAHIVSVFPTMIKTAVYSSTAHTITITPTGYEKLTITVSTASVTGTMTMIVAGSGSYWFDTVRPLRIEKVFIRDSGNLDTDLKFLNNNQFQKVYDKSTAGDAQYYNYVPKFPAGSIRLWPTPTISYTIGISQTPHLGRFYLLSSAVELPEGYELALEYQLAYEIASEYNKDPNIVYKQMIDKKAVLKITNMEPMILECDTIGMAQDHYDIISDR